MARRINAKLVLELLGKNMSARQIQSTRHIAQDSVRKVKAAAEVVGITWQDVANMDEREVYELLFPRVAEAESKISRPDYAYIHEELQKAGVTLKLLYEEHCDEAKSNNLVPQSYTTFCRGYREFTVTQKVTNHLVHKPGQVMEVDWAGKTMRLVNKITGEVSKAYLFVACLPYSQYSYVCATLDMKQNTWLSCHVKAWDFFGGVAARTTCDNLKTGVVKHPREGEIILNEAYEALGRHYVTAIMPTGVKKPKQKASVEGTVGKITTSIIAALRNREFETLAELNTAIQEKLLKFNEAPFQKREGSRKLVFDEVESMFLAPLPDVPFEVCDWVYGRNVNLNFHVVFKKNNYSVPYSLVGKKVDLKVTESLVEIYLDGERVATHSRVPSFLSYRYQTDPAHMPPDFAKPEWDDERIIRWAREIGPSTQAVIMKMFADAQIKEQAYNPALAVLNLSKHYGNNQLEEACKYSLSRIKHPRHKFIKSVLANKVIGNATPIEAPKPSGYLRGDTYYGKATSNTQGGASC